MIYLNDIITRYKQILATQIDLKIPNTIYTLVPIPNDETNDIHLSWMLNQIRYNTTQSETKKHRWLGYVQGVMICKGYLNVSIERELTRNIFNGK